MTYTRRLTAAMLTLLMIVNLLAVGGFSVSAAEPEAITIQEHYINPLYQDLICEETLTHSAPMLASGPEPLHSAGQEYLTSPEAAGQVLRDSMEQRQEICTIYYQTENYDGNQEAIRALLRQIAENALIHTGEPTEGDYLKWQYANWSANASATVNGSTYNWTFTYTYAYYTTAEQEAQVDAAVENVLNQLNVRDKSDYQKVQAIYDYICDNVVYDYSHLNDTSYKRQFTAYAALIEGTSVCQGYALLFYRLALELEVDTRLIAGVSRGDRHGWNIAKLGDLYYNLDSTWDAGKNSYMYFLRSGLNFSEHLRDDEFDTSAFHAEYPMATADFVPDISDTCEHIYLGGICEICGACIVTRIYGDNRYETGLKVADTLKANSGVEKFDVIVVASGTGFADALSGSYLANKKNAPILLVNKHSIGAVATYIKDNLRENGTVYLLGGEAAVPPEMEDALSGCNVRRLAGANRYETNLLILQEAGVTTEDILVCTSRDFADSLSASALNRPILLVRSTLTDAQMAFLDNLNGNPIYIIGGTGAVSEELASALTSYGTTERISGANRYETSVNVAKEFFADPTRIVLAYGHNFPDGLCGGVLAYNLSAPLILTRERNMSYAAEYAQLNHVSSGTVLGGGNLISDNVIRTVFSMAESEQIIVN